MSKITKSATIHLTKEEIESPDPIVLEFNVQDYEGETVTYTITYPKMVDGNGIGKAIGCLFYTAIIGVVLTLIFGGGLIWTFFGKDEIRSTKPIQPQIELVIEDNQVDTVYVYVEP